MSSLVRTIQKRIAKGMGFHRDLNPESPTFGKIINSAAEGSSSRWPQVKAPTLEKD